ncbi:MAG: rod shape-determining protein MreC [Candidatus Acidiferrales bacterium]
MIDFPSRQRPFTLLTVVVLAQVLLMAFQIKRERDVRLIRLWAVELLTPLQRAGTWSILTVTGGWRNYVDLRHTRADNEHLRLEVEQLELRNRELESASAEAGRLAALLNFREAHNEAPMLAAQVIGASSDSSSRTIFINRGEHDRLRRNMAVITPDGVVGKIVEVYPNTAQVLVITDKDSGVGALFSSTRTHGVIKGTGDPALRMEYVVNEEKVQPGEAVVTSGEDRIYPKDLPVGTVVDVKRGNTFQTIDVQPAARLDRLEDVIILLSQQEISLKKPAETAAPASQK